MSKALKPYTRRDVVINTRISGNRQMRVGCVNLPVYALADPKITDIFDAVLLELDGHFYGRLITRLSNVRSVITNRGDLKLADDMLHKIIEELKN